MRIAFLAAISYWALWCLDNITGAQALQRPMIMGMVVGAACGDIKTGIIIGGTLEGIFLGAIGIGGQTPSDWRIATTVTTAYVIGSGLDFEGAVAISAAIGVIANYFKQIGNIGSNALQPVYDRLAHEGKYKQFRALMFADLMVFKAGINAVIIFIFVALGEPVLQSVMGSIPKELLNGLTASSNLLVVVGLALLARSIWQKNTPLWVILGFVMAKYMGLNIIAVTAVGVVIAYCTYEFNRRTSLAAAGPAVKEEEDDFYA